MLENGMGRSGQDEMVSNGEDGHFLCTSNGYLHWTNNVNGQ